MFFALPTIHLWQWRLSGRDGSRPSVAVWTEVNSGGILVGAPAADTIVALFSYTCAFASEQALALDSVLLGPGSSVAVRYRFTEPNGQPQGNLETAAYCAAEADAFLRFHRTAIELRSQSTSPSLDSTALSLLRDFEIDVSSCLRDSSVSALLARDRATAEKLGQILSPTIVTRRQTALGFRTAAQLTALLRR